MGLFSGSKSKTNTQSSSQDRLFGPQAQALSFAFPQAQQLAQQQLPQAQQLAPQLSGQLGGLGQSFLGQLSGQNPFLQGLQQFQGGLAGQVDPLVDQLGQDIRTQFGRDLVGVGQNAAMSGARGGSRQGVAEGLLGEAAIQEFGRGSRQIRFGAAQADQLAQLQALLGGGQVSTQAAAQGLGQLGGQFDLGLAGLSGQFSPLQSLANLLPPTVLGESQQTSTTRQSGPGFGHAFGTALASGVF